MNIPEIEAGKCEKKSALRKSSSSKLKSFKQEKPQSRKVSFANSGDEVIVMSVNRAPPSKDNPIFDTNKSWITKLMSLKPRKPSIKILIDKKESPSRRKRVFDPKMENEENQILFQKNDSNSKVHYHYHKILNIDENTRIDYERNRVMYEEGNELFLVNARFSYT